MRLAILSLLAAGLLACGQQPEPAPSPDPDASVTAATPQAPAEPPDNPYTLRVGAGDFGAQTLLADLQTRFGTENVVVEDLPLGEGDTEAGAIIHPNDPSRRAYVHFVGGQIDATIAAIYIRDPESRWEGPLGVRMGMSLREVERINGGPLRFLGFGWDYGGTVSHWMDGNLARAFLAPGQLSLRLSPIDTDGEPWPDGYPIGDAEFSSDLEVIRALPPSVAEIGLVFIPPDETAAGEQQ